jgi:hypothetical protein
MGDTLYGYTLAEHDYSVAVPCMYRAPSDEPTVIIAISAHGGGTVGESYSDNGWDYSVYADGTEIIAGSDLRSGGMPATHEAMARTLAAFLSADAESLAYVARNGYCEDAGRLDVYGDDARAFLETEGERLGLFAAGLD